MLLDTQLLDPISRINSNMCRGFDQSGRTNGQALKIKAFYVRLLSSAPHASPSYSLTLHFPPRINGGPLDLDGFSVRPDTPAFVTLHRVVVTSGAVYGTRERLTVSEGARFEIYASDVRVLKGIVRKDEENWNWRLDCKAQPGVRGEELHLSEADVCVEVEGLGMAVETITQKVEMGGERRRKRINSPVMEPLEEIPEQRECELPEFCCCCCCGDDAKAGVDGEREVEMEVEGVRWAVDVGIWVACLGVGYLVSKASRNRGITRRMQSRLF